MSFSSPISVFVIDDHTLFRRGLIALIAQDAGLRVVGEAGDAGEALRLVPALAPQVILLDNHLPGVLGVDAIAGLRAASPGSRVVMLTVSEDGQDLAAALRDRGLPVEIVGIGGLLDEAEVRDLVGRRVGELVDSVDLQAQLLEGDRQLLADLPSPEQQNLGGVTGHRRADPVGGGRCRRILRIWLRHNKSPV